MKTLCLTFFLPVPTFLIDNFTVQSSGSILAVNISLITWGEVIILTEKYAISPFEELYNWAVLCMCLLLKHHLVFPPIVFEEVFWSAIGA